MRCDLVCDYDFEAAHQLPKVPAGHKCARMHGHSYAIQVRINGPIDEDKGWVMDFAAIDEVLRPLVKQLDHHVLNEIEGLENPTSENLAVWLWRRIKPQLPLLIEIMVAETRDSRCYYRGE